MVDRGFTLLELMIVIAIIAIIAAIAIPNLMASKRAANQSATIGAMRQYTTAQVHYQNAEYWHTNLGGAATDADKGHFAHSFEFLGGTAAGNEAPHLDAKGDVLHLMKSPVCDAVDAASAYQGYYFADITQHRGVANTYTHQHGLCAVPSMYAVSGVETYISNADGTVYATDQGHNTPYINWVDPQANGWSTP